MKQKRQAPYSYGIPQEYSHLHLPPKDFFSEIEVQDFPIRGKAVYLRVKIFELSQLEENKPIYIGDKQERRCIVHYDTPSSL